MTNTSPTTPQATMHGKICLVTGANAGIGYATSLGLAQQGATLILVARDENRGRQAQAAIQAASGNHQVTLLQADLSSQQQIHRLAEMVSARFPALHILVNNAAIIPPTRQLTEDGLETQLAVNHLAYFLLTNLLLPLLAASAPARIINVASQVHSGATISWDDMQSERHYQPSLVYAQTKLMNILFTYELARRLAGSGVTVNCLHPGVINTNLLYDYMGTPRTGRQRLLARGDEPDKGAELPLWLATAPELAGVSGQYFRSMQATQSSPASYDAAAARRLWQVSATLTGLA